MSRVADDRCAWVRVCVGACRKNTNHGGAVFQSQGSFGSLDIILSTFSLYVSIFLVLVVDPSSTWSDNHATRDAWFVMLCDAP